MTGRLRAAGDVTYNEARDEVLRRLALGQPVSAISAATLLGRPPVRAIGLAAGYGDAGAIMERPPPGDGPGEDWRQHAVCPETDPEAFFPPEGGEAPILVALAKRICRGCPVRTECLADALDNRIEFGIWGGMTGRERRALLRRSRAA
jgi:WhiB family transcriptional regulator, redox-sensing transcriptional regulator